MLTLVYCVVLKNIHRTLYMKNVIDVFYQEKKTKLILEQWFMSDGDIGAKTFFGTNTM
jgi:hypothetical protein